MHDSAQLFSILGKSLRCTIFGPTEWGVAPSGTVLTPCIAQLAYNISVLGKDVSSLRNPLNSMQDLFKMLSN